MTEASGCHLLVDETETRVVGSGWICFGPAMEEIKREPHGEERWCFHCRGRRLFEFVVMASVEPSWYGPNPSVRCATCDTRDGDLFPGREREWDEFDA